MSDPNLEPDPDPGSSLGAGGGDQPPPAPGPDPGEPGTPPPSPGATLPAAFWWLPFAIGGLILAGYAVFLGVMVTWVKVERELYWSRLIYLFTGVEALAFAAGGFFFGREVNRGRAEAAETRADRESRRAADATRREATANARGKVLTEGLRELADGAGAPQEAPLQGIAPPGARTAEPVVPAQQLRRLADLAETWFPAG